MALRLFPQSCRKSEADGEDRQRSDFEKRPRLDRGLALRLQDPHHPRQREGEPRGGNGSGVHFTLEHNLHLQLS
jgi:hypothetical protein